MGNGLDVHNQQVFNQESVTRQYSRLSGWLLDAGEREMLLHAARWARNRNILDVGVGVGRTTPLLRLMSDSYVGIDYAPRMVEACKARFPDIDIRIGDARSLPDFDDGTQGLVFFGANAIDAVAHDDRRRVLAEFARLIGTSGVTCFSTLNMHGMSYGEKFFQFHRPGARADLSLRRAEKFVQERVVRMDLTVRSIVNLHRNRALAEAHKEWAYSPMRLHEFSAVVHFSSLAGLRAEVASAGLRIEAIYATDGTPIDSATSESTADNFNVVARRSDAARFDAS